MAYGFTYTLPTITGSHTDFPVVLKTADFPTGAKNGGANSLLNGGGDLRAYTDDTKATQLPLDVVRFVTGGTPDIEVHTKVPTAATSNTIYLEADDVATTQPAVTNTYGRNAVWSDFGAVFHLSDGTDSTGNGNDLVIVGSPVFANGAVEVDSAGVTMRAPYDASIAGLSTYEITMFASLFNQTVYWGGLNGEQGSAYNWLGIDHDGTQYPNDPNISGGVRANGVTSSPSLTDLAGVIAGTWLQVVYSHDGSEHRLLGNEVIDTIAASGTMQSNTEYALTIGNKTNSAAKYGIYDEHRIGSIVHSYDWHQATRANFVATLAWGTVGSWADGGGGVSIEIPTSTHAITTYAPTITASNHISIEIPTSAHLITTYAPTVSIGDNVDIEIPTLDNSVTAYAPTIAISGSVSIEIPTSAHGITTYAPSISISDHISIQIPVLLHQIRTYAPHVQIGTAPTISINLESRITVMDNCLMPITTTQDVTTPIQDDDITITGLIRQQQPLTASISSAELTNYATIEPTINLIATMRG